MNDTTRIDGQAIGGRPMRQCYLYSALESHKSYKPAYFKGTIYKADFGRQFKAELTLVWNMPSGYLVFKTILCISTISLSCA